MLSADVGRTSTSRLARREPMMTVLRRGTRAHHAAAERWAALVGGAATWDAYRAYLGVMSASCAVLEPALERVEGLVEALPSWPARRKAPLLARDREHLAAIGHPIDAPADGALEPPRSVAEAFGALYVIEGSTLGGRVIARHVGQALGVTDERGGSFLHAYGAEVGSMWRSFGRAVDAFAVGRPERATVLASARRTFTSITRMLARGRP